MPFQFNPEIAQQIANVLGENESPMTAREIAKELGQDKHIINQHLYKIDNLVKSHHRIPVWSLPPREDQRIPDTARVYLQNLQGEISTMLLTDFFQVENQYLPDFEMLPNGFVGYKMKPLEPAPEPVADVEEEEEEDVTRRKCVECGDTKSCGLYDSDRKWRCEDCVKQCISCGVGEEYGLDEYSEGILCSRCADDIDEESGKRRRDL
jgi:hypothetical protein